MNFANGHPKGKIGAQGGGECFAPYNKSLNPTTHARRETLWWFSGRWNWFAGVWPWIFRFLKILKIMISHVSKINLNSFWTIWDWFQCFLTLLGMIRRKIQKSCENRVPLMSPWKTCRNESGQGTKDCSHIELIYFRCIAWTPGLWTWEKSRFVVKNQPQKSKVAEVPRRAILAHLAEGECFAPCQKPPKLTSNTTLQLWLMGLLLAREPPGILDSTEAISGAHHEIFEFLKFRKIMILRLNNSLKNHWMNN